MVYVQRKPKYSSYPFCLEDSPMMIPLDMKDLNQCAKKLQIMINKTDKS